MAPEEAIKQLFRYERRTFAGWAGTEFKLHLEAYEVASETPQGYWIKVNTFSKKWVSKTSRKRFAYPTEKEALHNVKVRTERCLLLQKAQLKNTERFLELINAKCGISNQINIS